MLSALGLRNPHHAKGMRPTEALQLFMVQFKSEWKTGEVGRDDTVESDVVEHET